MEVDSTTRISRAQSTAAKAEREAADRVTAAQKNIRDASREEEKQLDHLRDQYEARSNVERARGENYIEAVRNRNYESVSELNRRAENEQHRAVSAADRDLKELGRQYQDAEYTTVRKGEADLKNATTQNYKQQQHERATGEEQLNVIKSNFAEEKAQIEANRRETTKTLTSKSQTHRKDLEAQTQTAVEESTEHYQAAFDGAMKQNRDALADLNWRAARGVEEVKRETTQKLDGYATLKSDPFYQLINVDGKITESADQFVFTAKIPSHEQDRININIRGNELIISGKRKSEESLEVEPGRTMRTNSYQSFSENFPLGFPVDPKNMTREFAGDTLVVRIPKKTAYEPVKPKKEVERATLQRPQFPKNLPGEKELARMNDPARGPNPQDENTPPSKRNKTGKTFA